MTTDGNIQLLIVEHMYSRRRCQLVKKRKRVKLSKFGGKGKKTFLEVSAGNKKSLYVYHPFQNTCEGILMEILTYTYLCESYNGKRGYKYRSKNSGCSG